MSVIDTSKIGFADYRTLQRQNLKDLAGENAGTESDISEQINLTADSRVSPYYMSEANYMDGPVKSAILQQGKGDYWGNSVWDEDTATEGDLSDAGALGDIRADNQWGIAQVGAGILKGTVLAGTTFIDGTLGLAAGIGQSIKDGDISGLWNNPVSKALKSVNEASEEIFKNYYTQDQIENPMAFRNIFSANFLGDKFIKNLGFTVGAFYSGSAYSKVLTKAMQVACASQKVGGILTSGAGAFMSALNEGRIEAINNSSDWRELQKAKIDDDFKQRSLEIQMSDRSEMEKASDLYALQMAYEKNMDRLDVDSAKMGNVDMMLNLPILLASNLFQFAKLYSNGWKAAVEHQVRKGANGYKAALNPVTASLKGAVSEGSEELLQTIASDTSGNYYQTDMENYHRASIDPEVEQEQLDWIKAFDKSVKDNLSSESSWEEFMIGALTGMLGMPRFRSRTNEKGEKQSPFVLEGGILGDWKEYQKQNEMAEKLNQRFQDPNFDAYYKGLIRHGVFQKRMNQAAAAGDKFDFNNAEEAQMISDIQMWDQAGVLDDLVERVNSLDNESDTSLEEIVRNTTTNEDGVLSGPFSQYAKIDSTTGEMVVNMSEDNKNAMREKIKGNKERLVNAIKNYTEVKDNINMLTNYALKPEELNELTYYAHQIKEWDKRGASMVDDLKKELKNVVAGLQSEINELDREHEVKQNTGITETEENEYKAKRQEISDKMALYNNIVNTDSGLAANTIGNNEAIATALADAMENSPYVQDTDRAEAAQKARDLKRLQEARKEYRDKLNEYLKDPEAVKRAQAYINLEVSQKYHDKRIADLKEKVNNTTSQREFNRAMDSLPEEDRKLLEKELRKKKDARYKEYKRMKDYIKSVRKHIRDNGASELFYRRIMMSENMSELEDQANDTYMDGMSYSAKFDDNGNPVDMTDEELEDAYNKHAYAQYDLHTAENRAKQKSWWRRMFSMRDSIVLPSNVMPVIKGNTARFYVRDKKTKKLKRTKIFVGRDDLVDGDYIDEDTSMFCDEIRVFLYKDTGDKIYMGDVTHKYSDGVVETFEEQFKDWPSLMENPFEEKPSPVNNDEDEDDKSGLLDEILYRLFGGKGEHTKKDAKEDDEDIRKRKEKENDDDNELVEKKSYWRPAISEKAIGWEKNNDMDNTPFGVLNKDFENIWNYINREGGFTYVNEGNLHQGDRVYFMIDPNYEQNESPDNSKPTVFLVTRKADGSWQVLNVLSNTDAAFKKQPGSKQLYERVVDAYNKSGNKASGTRFYSKEFTRVSKIMNGCPCFSSNDINLRDSLGMQDGTNEPKFAIMQNGSLVAPGVTTPIEPLNNPSRKEGRAYLLLKNAKGTLTPIAVRTAHFNKREMDIDNPDIANLPIVKNIMKAVEILATAKSNKDVNMASEVLRDSLYMGGLFIDYYEGKNGPTISIKRPNLRANGDIVYTEKVDSDGKRKRITQYDEDASSEIELSGKNLETLKDEIVNALYKANVQIQLSAKLINKSPNYNSAMINQGLLTADIKDGHVSNSWFTMDYMDEDGNIQKATNPESRKARNTANGIIVATDRGVYAVDLSTNTIRNESGDISEFPIKGERTVMQNVNIQDPDLPTRVQLIYGLAIVYKRYLNSDGTITIPSDGVNLISVDVTNPDGSVSKERYTTVKVGGTDKVINIDKGNFVTDESADDIRKKLGTPAPTPGTGTPTQTNISPESQAIVDKYKQLSGIDLSEVVKPENLVPMTIYQKQSDGSYKKVTSSVVNMAGRNIVVLNINGTHVPFYMSTGKGGKKTVKPNEWYPFFGIGSDEWINKSTEDDINNFYGKDYFKAISELLKITFLDINGDTDTYEGNQIGLSPVKTKEKGDFFQKVNKDVVPTDNGASDTKERLKESIDKLTGLIDKALNPHPSAGTSDEVGDGEEIPVNLGDDSSDTGSSSDSTSDSTSGGVDPFADMKDGDDPFDYLLVSEVKEYKPWDKKAEMAWLDSVLPQLSREDRIKFIEGFDITAENKAYGAVRRGLMILSNQATEGTVYHEAFHILMQNILSAKDVNNILHDASRKYGRLSPKELEEKLAEDFRMYMISKQQPKGLGRRILDFFKSLFVKVSNWAGFSHNAEYYFNRLASGYYTNSNLHSTQLFKDRNISVKDISESHDYDNYDENSQLDFSQDYAQSYSENPTSEYDKLDDEDKSLLYDQGVSAEIFNSLSPEELETAKQCIGV